MISVVDTNQVIDTNSLIIHKKVSHVEIERDWKAFEVTKLHTTEMWDAI